MGDLLKPLSYHQRLNDIMMHNAYDDVDAMRHEQTYGLQISAFLASANLEKMRIFYSSLRQTMSMPLESVFEIVPLLDG